MCFALSPSCLGWIIIAGEVIGEEESLFIWLYRAAFKWKIRMDESKGKHRTGMDGMNGLLFVCFCSLDY